MTRETLVAYGATFLAFVVIDLVFLTAIGAGMFRATLGDVMAPTLTVAPAVLFYLLFPIGIVFFAIEPAAGQWQAALMRGALFGFFAYATYEFTNHATIRNWGWNLVAVDLTWGTVLTGTAATIGLLVARMVTGRG